MDAWDAWLLCFVYLTAPAADADREEFRLGVLVQRLSALRRETLARLAFEKGYPLRADAGEQLHEIARFLRVERRWRLTPPADDED